MNSYLIIFSRGSEYVDSADDNWSNRRDKLLKVWITNYFQRARIEKIIATIDLRLANLRWCYVLASNAKFYFSDAKNLSHKNTR